jgi:hypothetical protein
MSDPGMDQLREMLFEIRGDLGRMEGTLGQVLTEQTRQATAVAQHIEEDRATHAAQDDRLLKAIQGTSDQFLHALRQLNGQFVEAVTKLVTQFVGSQRVIEERVANLEQARIAEHAAHATSERWRAAIFALASLAAGFFGGLLSHWPGRHG